MHLSYVYNIPKLIMFNPFFFVCLFATYYQYYQFHIYFSTFYKISTKIIPERMSGKKTQGPSIWRWEILVYSHQVEL